MRLGQVRSGQARPSQVRSGQVRSDVIKQNNWRLSQSNKCMLKSFARYMDMIIEHI